MKKLKKIISVLLILSIFIINTKNLLVFADEVIIKNKVEKSVDAKPPTIDVDSLKVNKTEVRPGDTVKISIKASDDISGIRQIDIRYKRPITGSSEDISMKYNSQKDIYEGSLYIDDQTQDGLWQIEFIFLVDNKDNYGYIYNSNINRYRDNLEDLSAGNFKVKNDDNTSIIVNDIKNHWASSDINNFINKGYISGYQDGTFKPNNDITRAEFVKIVNRVSCQSINFCL